MRTFGLIGYPLGHSFSQKYFTEKFKRENINDAEFKNFSVPDLTAESFNSLIDSNPALQGLSITIPYKQDIIKFMHQVDAVAKETGAVNCIKVIWKTEDGGQRLKGYNTDVFGFEKSLLPLLKDHHTKALILGTGGAAKAVEYVLKKLRIEYFLVSRSEKQAARSYKDLDKELISSHTIIINATPVGMFPNVDACPPIPYEYLTNKHLLYDLIYNPEETLFLKKGKEKGAQIKNGLEMLELQAEKAWEIWNNHQ